MKRIGAVLLAMSSGLLLFTVASMWWTIRSVKTAATPPQPSDLADGLSHSLLFGGLAVPLGILGLLLLLLGYFFPGKPNDSDEV